MSEILDDFNSSPGYRHQFSHGHADQFPDGHDQLTGVVQVLHATSASRCNTELCDIFAEMMDGSDTHVLPYHLFVIPECPDLPDDSACRHP